MDAALGAAATSVQPLPQQEATGTLTGGLLAPGTAMEGAAAAARPAAAVNLATDGMLPQHEPAAAPLAQQAPSDQELRAGPSVRAARQRRPRSAAKKPVPPARSEAPKRVCHGSQKPRCLRSHAL